MDDTSASLHKVKSVLINSENATPDDVFIPEPEPTELERQEAEENLPLSVRERRQTIQVYETFREKAKWGEFYRVYGLVLLALGGYFLSVPFYNVVC